MRTLRTSKGLVDRGPGKEGKKKLGRGGRRASGTEPHHHASVTVLETALWSHFFLEAAFDLLLSAKQIDKGEEDQTAARRRFQDLQVGVGLCASRAPPPQRSIP